MKKRVIINSLSEFSTPNDFDRCGYALTQILKKCGDSSKYPTIVLDVIKHNHHKLVVDFYFEVEREYQKLKLDFLYDHAASFTWREKCL